MLGNLEGDGHLGGLSVEVHFVCASWEESSMGFIEERMQGRRLSSNLSIT